MSAHAPQIRLRLVDSDAAVPRQRQVSPPGPVLRSDLALAGQPRPDATGGDNAAIASANRQAARMSALDARWILAVQAYRSLDGGRAAIITPESRQRLMTLGQRVGLRPFDCSLVIAVVQDAARAGEDPLGPMATDRLSLVHAGDSSFLLGESSRSPRVRVAWAIATIGIAAVIAMGAARWLLM